MIFKIFFLFYLLSEVSQNILSLSLVTVDPEPEPELDEVVTGPPPLPPTLSELLSPTKFCSSPSPSDSGFDKSPEIKLLLKKIDWSYLDSSFYIRHS